MCLRACVWACASWCMHVRANVCWMHTCTPSCMCSRVSIRSVCVRTYVLCAWVHTGVCVCMHVKFLQVGTHMQMHLRTCVCVCAHAHVHLRACMPVFIAHASPRACVWVCSLARVYACEHAYACIQVCTCMRVCTCMDIHARLCVHVRACMLASTSVLMWVCALAGRSVHLRLCMSVCKCKLVCKPSIQVLKRI